MNLRSAYLIFLLLVSPGIVAAQKVELAKPREPGDKAIFKFVFNNKTTTLEENWIALTDDEMVGVQKIDGKEYEIILGRSPPYQLRKMMCLAAGVACVFSPGFNFVEFPIEKGKTWTQAFTITAATFVADIQQVRVVEGFEKLRVPAGEFETYKIAAVGRIKGKNSKGDLFVGKEESTEWMAIVSGKLVMVKVVWKNSFGEKFSLELISSSF